MDTLLAIASRREVRDYEPRALPRDVEERILDAGRLAGSSKNRQPWRFHVVPGELLVEAVYEPTNLRGAPFVVAIVVRGKGPGSIDEGPADQNMLLAAWNEGVGASPNGISDEPAARAVLELEDEERLAIVLSFGYPAKPRNPGSHSVDEWSARAKRRPLQDIVRDRAVAGGWRASRRRDSGRKPPVVTPAGGLEPRDLREREAVRLGLGRLRRGRRVPGGAGGL